MAETAKERRQYAKTLQVARAEARLGAQEKTGTAPGSVAAGGLGEARVGEAISRLLALQVGWVRLVPDCEGCTWCKFRYTSGRWEGSYSLAVHRPALGTLAEALEALEHKVIGALMSPPTHKPSPDRY